MVYRRRRSRRSRAPRAYVRTYKKVLDFAPISNGSGKINHLLVSGADSVAIGQTGVTDAIVPTGSRVTEIHINFMSSQIVGGSVFQYLCMQMLLPSQGTVGPRNVGGSSQRNQVFYQDAYSIGINQNANRVFRFKIPPRFQRVKEGMQWYLVTDATNTVTNALQVIYKVML